MSSWAFWANKGKEMGLVELSREYLASSADSMELSSQLFHAATQKGKFMGYEGVGLETPLHAASRLICPLTSGQVCTGAGGKPPSLRLST
jgi:hypothetical protein